MFTYVPSTIMIYCHHYNSPARVQSFSRAIHLQIYFLIYIYHHFVHDTSYGEKHAYPASK